MQLLLFSWVLISFQNPFKTVSPLSAQTQQHFSDTSEIAECVQENIKGAVQVKSAITILLQLCNYAYMEFHVTFSQLILSWI